MTAPEPPAAAVEAAARAIYDEMIERELADAEALAAKVEAAWDWIARAEPYPELGGDLLGGLRLALSVGRHCAHCYRPLPHNDAEQRACSGQRNDHF